MCVRLQIGLLNSILDFVPGIEPKHLLEYSVVDKGLSSRLRSRESVEAGGLLSSHHYDNISYSGRVHFNDRFHRIKLYNTLLIPPAHRVFLHHPPHPRAFHKKAMTPIFRAPLKLTIHTAPLHRVAFQKASGILVPRCAWRALEILELNAGHNTHPPTSYGTRLLVVWSGLFYHHD